MKNVRMVFAAIISATVLGMAPTAYAQQPSLVDVDISNVANNIAESINVDVSQIPATVQAPVDVAANVCVVAAIVLGEQAESGEGSCKAETTSTALNQIVQRQIRGTG